MKNKFPTIWHFLAIIVFYGAFSYPFAKILPLLSKSYFHVGLLTSTVISLTLTIWATRKAFDLKGKIPFKINHLKILPLVILGAYAFFIVGEFSVAILPEPTGKFKIWFDAYNKTIQKVFENKTIAFLMVSVSAPIFEEILFRGIVLKYLLKKVAPWTAIILTAVGFGLFHFNPWQFMYATTLGVVLGYMYWKTNSLFYPMLIHFILNTTAFVASFYVDLGANEAVVESVSSKKAFYLTVLFAIGIIYLLYLFMEKYFANQQKQLVLATQNDHKIEEIKKILPKNIALASLKDIGFEGELKETGQTLDANARQKMRQIAVPYAVDALADDTGLEVDALGGAPGVYSARYSGENATYESNVAKLLQEMEGKENRQARFRTVMALSFGPEEKYFEGIINGIIATEPRGTNGFGYDSVFIPEGENRTFAEMSDDEKNAISHRARALQELKKYFEEKEVKGKR